MRYHNFFSPMMRLEVKQRDGSKVTRRYRTATTPYRRLLMADGHIGEATRESLRREYESTNPAGLLRQITALLHELEDKANAAAEPRGD